MRLVLVHGAVVAGEATWARQRSLAKRYELVVLDRPGFAPGPPPERVDFEEDARWLERRLEPGDHVCAHSYGAVVAMYAAAARGALGSLTLVEPPSFRVAAHDPAVRALVERGPWEADPPLERLAAGSYPKLVVSGGWSPAFEAVCDALERRLGAERAVLAGAGHNVQAAPGFNERLESFLG